ncbi:MAG: FGGY family carbohydrate kinase [Vulcanimicrobiaceae bacterium]
MLIGIDQGTSGTTVCAFDEGLEPLAQAQRPLRTRAPRDGWVEHDPGAIEASIIQTVGEVFAKTSRKPQACGLANQGESVLAWDARTLEPLTSVIVWNDTRAATIAAEASDDETIRSRTGLRRSPYFCAPKLAWLLRNDLDVKHAVDRGEAQLGTLDTWLLRRLGLSEGITDESTASRSALYGLAARAWDDELLRAFGIPRNALAAVKPALAAHGVLHHASWREPLPLFASLVDQPAALAGNGCFSEGDLKITYGTGAFVVKNCGNDATARAGGLLTSVAWSDRRAATYAIDGGVFSAGTAIAWAIERGIARDAPAMDAAARQSGGAGAVSFVLAIHGLGAPWWNPDARAHFEGAGGATTGQLAAAIFDGIALRVCDIVRALHACGQSLPQTIFADGGVTRSEYLMQRQADLLGLPIEASQMPEATARGAAALAGIARGLRLHETVRNRGAVRRYEPRITGDERLTTYDRWLNVVTLDA